MPTENEFTQYLLQFERFENRNRLLPETREKGRAAAYLGIKESEYADMLASYDAAAKAAALEILKEKDVADLLLKMPFEKGDKILAVGDFATSDRQGWFEILSHVLDIGLSDLNLEFVNTALPDNTTTSVLGSFDVQVVSEAPDWVFVMLGSNDCKRMHYAADRTLVSLSDSWENLNSLDLALRERLENPVVWVSPNPVINELIEEFEIYNFSIEEVDLAACREIMTGKGGFIVDPRGNRLGNPPEAWHLLADGLHPSTSGHVETVKQVLNVLVKEEKKAD